MLYVLPHNHATSTEMDLHKNRKTTRPQAQASSPIKEHANGTQAFVTSVPHARARQLFWGVTLVSQVC